MILLDTDHVTILRYEEHPRCVALNARLESARELGVAITVITLEEQMRGWLAEIGRRRQVHQQITDYENLASLCVSSLGGSLFRSTNALSIDSTSCGDNEFASVRRT